MDHVFFKILEVVITTIKYLLFVMNIDNIIIILWIVVIMINGVQQRFKIF